MLPTFLVENFIFNNHENNSRFVKSPIANVHNSTSAITANSLLFKGILLYNKINYNLKTLNIKQFKKEIKHYIKEKLPPDRIVGQSDYV